MSGDYESMWEELNDTLRKLINYPVTPEDRKEHATIVKVYEMVKDIEKDYEED